MPPLPPLLDQSLIIHAALLVGKDLKEVKNFIWGAYTKWSHLGLELGLLSSTLEAIRIKFRDDPTECFNKMLMDWLAGQGLEATWRNLYLALKASPVNHPALAKAVEERYLKTSHPPGNLSAILYSLFSTTS